MKDLEVRDPVPPTKRVHKLVLTGGPCGGKTTGQAHLATFFESLGWKVFRVPETATVLMSGGISFGELNEEQVEILCLILAGGEFIQLIQQTNGKIKYSNKVTIQSVSSCS